MLMAGVSTQDSADKLKVHRNTINRMRKRMAAFIGDEFDLTNYRMPLYGLYNLWLKSMVRNLNILNHNLVESSNYQESVTRELVREKKIYRTCLSFFYLF